MIRRWIPICLVTLLAWAFVAPTAEARRRCVKRDRMVKLNYTHGGQVWIPRRVSCGGTAFVVILLHGNNQRLNRHPTLGGGRRVERLVSKYVRGRLIWPVILAEPVHHGACAKAAKAKGLPPVFGGRFSFAVYKKKLQRLLRKRGIKVKSWSLLAHSGAGCCAGAGIYAAARVFKRVYVFGTSDACYGSRFYTDFVHKRFGGKRTRVVNTCRGIDAHQDYQAYERRLVGKRPRRFRPCDRRYYKRCLRNRRRLWYAYVTKPRTVRSHRQVFTEFIKTVLFKFFRNRRRR
jgi:hypothetical protein